MSKNLTTRDSHATGKPLLRRSRKLMTVGALRKALENWPDKMRLTRPGYVVVSYNVGLAGESVGIEESDMV